MGNEQDFNPIHSVDGIAIPPPAKGGYTWELEDLSDNSTAGRTEDNVMHKARKGQAVKLNLKWENLTTEEINIVLNVFQNEYVTVEYLDPLFGVYRKAVFYVGNRSAVAFNTRRGKWESVSFSIIEQEASVKNV